MQDLIDRQLPLVHYLPKDVWEKTYDELWYKLGEVKSAGFNSFFLVGCDVRCGERSPLWMWQ